MANRILKGHVPLGFVVLRGDAVLELADLKEALVTLMRSHIGAAAAFRQVCAVLKLLKTRSGKILRGGTAHIGGRRQTRDPADDRRSGSA